MHNHKSSVSKRYILFIFVGSFLLAVAFSLLSETLTRSVKSVAISLTGLLFIILIGILADIIGTAVTAAQEAPFHARAAKRVRGAKEGVFLLRNADKVANICNDVIGDIVGTVSGALGISIVVKILNNNPGWPALWANIIMTALIASLTVSGKALGKTLALTRANDVIFLVGKILAYWQKITGKRCTKKNRPVNKKRVNKV
ncbi:hypothetical protein [Desulforamulus hydrothermalis]|uniref:CNNM transmembrane domain-containing protein n=1 Tax=Desulforamulus hydrothermalis Lam5 = DSM 18033 TaxID=1121428 RepID=K8EK57_9FIRM|nr:hypothetical protein [Desulforamulus hydrothermalis]CCO08926.1 conserved membrane hypothetical protein [Desulforamulus hydrothermalis Lam5 = DSM 18033]SHG74939.1 hypothetical protein SAMN02745177_00243 [Desulforamulus hydrothermalis Lam5 = DSM 18033]